MIWRDAVIQALRRYTMRHETTLIERQRLIDEEMAEIISATQSQGATPTQTLSRELQELKGTLLAFLGDGRYLFLDKPFDVTTPIEAITTETIENAVQANKLLLPTVETSDVVRSQRVRQGQQAIRKYTLSQYRGRCALCEIQEANFLIASHIVGWAERENSRGDLSNVMCLCRFHDPLFEQGYISLSDSFEVLKKYPSTTSLLSQVLDKTIDFTPPIHYPPSSTFLSYHRQKNGF